MKAFTTILCIVLLSPPMLFGQPAVTVQLQLVAGGRAEPVAITNAGDSRLFVVERAGRIQILNADGSWAPQPFLDIATLVNDGGIEQGLLGLAFHPNYAMNGFFYVHYTGGTGVGTSVVSRFSVSANPNDANEGSQFIIWDEVQPGPNTNHRGGDLHFGPDGNLWFALGDAGGTGDPSNYAQNLNLPWGKMLRINVNSGSPYSIPATNPYAGGGGLAEIWASGMRNPWRFSIDEVTGDVWIGDVGQGVWEEIDRWPSGDNSAPNFGWRCYEGTGNYNTVGCGALGTYDAPIAQHNQNTGWCAIVGGHVYRGSDFPRLSGRYIYTDWCLGTFISLRPDGANWEADTLLESGIIGYAAIGEGMDGELYVCNQQNGEIRRIIDPIATVQVSAKVFLEGPFDNATDQMKDDLRVAGYLAVKEPYSALGFVQLGSGGETVPASVRAVAGANAIVDWVRLELRQSGSPTTVMATANALLQRDGDVVATDGSSSVTFAVAPGSYHVAIRHRNHLGCMTATTRALTVTAATVDFRVTGTSTYGTAARKTLDSHQLLWAGNATHDNMLVYVGAGNDRDPLLLAIGGSVPTGTVTGYRQEDINMDGVTRYIGGANDRDPILVNIGGAIPTSTKLEQLP